MRTINFKKTLSYIPEVSLLIISLFWFFESLIRTSEVNYLMILLTLAVAAIMIWRIKSLALILSAVLALVSLFMLLAVFSEFNEFPKGSAEGTKLLLTGSLIFTTLLGMSALMPIKYFAKKKSF